MKIQIQQLPNGEFNIRSEACGPFGTIAVLRQVISLLEKAGAEQEEKAARDRVAIPSPEQTRELVGV